MDDSEGQLAGIADGAIATADPECYLAAPGGMKIQLVPETGVIIPPGNSPQEIRAWIKQLTHTILGDPSGHNEFQLKHTFLDGMYVREMFIPKGTLLIGKVHRVAGVNIVSSGDISVLTEFGSARVGAGYSGVSPPGTQKVGYAHEDTVFINIFRTDETDPERIESAVAFEDYVAVDQWDYGLFLDEYGLTEPFVQSVVEDMSDHVEMPPEFTGFVRAPSKIHGDGLFAAVDLPPGALVAPARIGRNRTVAGRITNHAKTPNCQLVEAADGGMDLRTLRAVAAGDELTLDYRQAARANTALGLTPRKEEICQ